MLCILKELFTRYTALVEMRFAYNCTRSSYKRFKQSDSARKTPTHCRWILLLLLIDVGLVSDQEQSDSSWSVLTRGTPSVCRQTCPFAGIGVKRKLRAPNSGWFQIPVPCILIFAACLSRHYRQFVHLVHTNKAVNSLFILSIKFC